MRSTLIFIGLLLAVSCTSDIIDGSYHPALLEISQDPRADAIFATIAVQMKQESGFQRVQALLNTLADEARKQAHDARKLFQKTITGCDVARHVYKQKAEVITNYISINSHNIKDAKETRAFAKDTVDEQKKASTFFTGFLEREKAEHKAEGDMLDERVKLAKQGSEEVSDLLKIVKNMSTKTETSFIQSKLDKISEIYLQTHSMKVFVPASFVETAAQDDQVKQRITEWLNQLNVAFHESQGAWETSLGKRRDVWQKIENQTEDLITNIGINLQRMTVVAQVAKESVQNLEATDAKLNEWKQGNQELMASNEEYCNVEDENFNKAHVELKAQVKLFNKIRDFFRKNYENIDKFIKSNYH